MGYGSRVMDRRRAIRRVRCRRAYWRNGYLPSSDRSRTSHLRLAYPFPRIREGYALMDDTRRLTYGELAAARGVTVATARRMATRYKWPKQMGNDGLARVSVPEAALRANTPAKVSRTEAAPEAVAALEAVIEALQEEVRDTRERAERADQAAGVLRAKLAAARYAGEIVRAEVGDLRCRLDTATQQLGEALQQVRLLTDQRSAPARRSWLPWRRRA